VSTAFSSACKICPGSLLRDVQKLWRTLTSAVVLSGVSQSTYMPPSSKMKRGIAAPNTLTIHYPVQDSPRRFLCCNIRWCGIAILPVKLRAYRVADAQNCFGPGAVRRNARLKHWSVSSQSASSTVDDVLEIIQTYLFIPSTHTDETKASPEGNGIYPSHTRKHAPRTDLLVVEGDRLGDPVDRKPTIVSWLLLSS
jgi:hypothetical protein